MIIFSLNLEDQIYTFDGKYNKVILENQFIYRFFNEQGLIAQTI